MKLSLNAQIFLGATVGVIGGIILQHLGPASPVSQNVIYWCGILGGIFTGLLKMILIPLIFLSISTGIANLQSHARMHRVWIYTLLYFFTASSLAIILGLTAVNIFKPGVGLHLDLFKDAAVTFDAKSMTVAQFAQNFLGNLFMNPIEAMAKTEVLPTVVFAMIFGIALVALGPKARTIRQVLTEIFEVIMTIVQWIMHLAPIGIAALLMKMVAVQNIALLKSLATFVSVVVGSTLIHGLIVLPLLLWIITRTNPVFFFKGMADALVTAFSTSSSSATRSTARRSRAGRGSRPRTCC